MQVPVGTPSAAATLTLSDTELAALPGETAVTTATVHNGGSQVEQFVISIAGPTAPWAVIEPPTLQVYPGERTQCSVRLTPPRESSTAAGRAWFTVRATSALHPGLAVGANGALEVGAFRELAATLVPQSTSGRWRTAHRLDLANTGNVVEPVRVQAADAAGRLQFGVPAGEVPVPPGTTRVNLPVRSRLRLLGKPQSSPFQVIVVPRPPSPPIRLDGSRDAVPLIAGWVPKLVAMLAILVAAAIAAVFIAPRLNTTSTSSTAGTSPTPIATGTGGPVNEVSPSNGPASPTASPSASPSVTPSPRLTLIIPPIVIADGCKTGYVWRLAFDTDHVCVIQAVRNRVVADNAAASGRWTSGAYGPDTCLQGYVWREASQTDHVCVTGDVRTQAAQDNAQATSRLAVAPKLCISGYVWREAFPTDYVCVTPATRSQAAADNAQANARRNPTGPYGPTTCQAGYVWREARPVDHVCVTSAVRTQTAYDNSQAGSRTK